VRSANIFCDKILKILLDISIIFVLFWGAVGNCGEFDQLINLVVYV